MPTESNHYFPGCQLQMGGFQNPNQIEDAFIKKSATSISAFLLGSYKKKISLPTSEKIQKDISNTHSA